MEGHKIQNARRVKEFSGSLGNSAKGALLTIFEKGEKMLNGLEDGKRRLASFFFWFQKPLHYIQY